MAQGLDWGDLWQEEIWTVARERLPDPVWRHYEQGSHAGLSAAEAEEAWSQLRFAPRTLRDVSDVDTATSLLGLDLPSPLAVAPTSMQRHADPDGEVAMARGVAAAGSLLVVPTNAGSTFEEIAATGVTWWLQTYLTVDRSLIEAVIMRGVTAGARAIVLTVDTPRVSTRFGSTPDAWAGVPALPARSNFGPGGAQPVLPGAAHARDVTVADIGWLAELSGLPVVVKGVLRADDARRAVQAGAAAIWVSNHGGRQLDRAVATPIALRQVVSAVGPGAEIYVDGGIRNGLDTLAALAAGARGVFLGRLPLFALAAFGDVGVQTALERMNLELSEALTLSGCATLTEVPGILFEGS